MIPLWIREFGTGFDVPAVVTEDPAIEDISWHNDVAPSFCLKGAPPGTDLRLWVDHPDPDMRECDGPRFMVMDHNTERARYMGDSIEDAIRILKGQTI